MQKIISHWSFDSEINWLKDLAIIIKNNLTNISDIVIQFTDIDTLFIMLFAKCVEKKEGLLLLKPVRSINELLISIGITESIKKQGGNPYFSNQYELDKIVTEQYIIRELSSLKIKIENKNFKEDIKHAKKENREISGEVDSLNRILEVAQTKIKIRRNITFDIAIKVYPHLKNEISSIAEKQRFNNGKLNFSKLGRIFGINNKTAKSWCEKLGIPMEIPQLN